MRTCMLQIVSGTTAGDVHACCTPLQQGAALHVPAASEEGSSSTAHNAHSTQRIGTLTAPVRDACPACTTGLAITAQGGVCATFASSVSRRPEHGVEDIACWQLQCSAPHCEVTPAQETGVLQQQDGAWWLERVRGVLRAPVVRNLAACFHHVNPETCT